MSCQPWSSHQSHRAQENQSARVAFTLLDEDDVGVGPSRLLTATLTLIDLETERIINSRNAQNVINANNVTITEEGRVTWDLQVLLFRSALVNHTYSNAPGAEKESQYPGSQNIVKINNMIKISTITKVGI